MANHFVIFSSTGIRRRGKLWKRACIFPSLARVILRNEAGFPGPLPPEQPVCAHRRARACPWLWDSFVPIRATALHHFTVGELEMQEMQKLDGTICNYFHLFWCLGPGFLRHILPWLFWTLCSISACWQKKKKPMAWFEGLVFPLHCIPCQKDL